MKISPYWERFLLAIILLAVLQLGCVLYNGDYTLDLLGRTINTWRLATQVILILLLNLFRLFLKHRTSAWELRSGAILFSLLMVIYLSNNARIGARDTIPSAYLPISLLREGDLDLDEFDWLYAKGFPYYMQQVDGH